MSTDPHPHRLGRRAVLGTVTLAAVGGSLAAATRWALAGETPTAVAAAAPKLLWHPSPGTDGLKAFEGVEADRVHAHPNRKYVYVEGDHYRFDIYRDDRDTTGGGDRQRTEVRGMVSGGSKLKMHNGETWRITYEMFMPATLHGTSKFTHIFQLKTPATNGGPWMTVSLHRSGSKETLQLQADSTSGVPVVGATDLSPLREKWITVELTFKIGPSGTGRFLVRNGTGSGAAVVVDKTKSGLNIPDQGDYVRPKWGIYRSIESASSDILDTHLFIRNYQAYRGA
ncbi:hypothetical protein [Actinoplanes subtropicus]|uniref:hypothetical protein n=1 Tax=Actinoplanes subtropicus TaxID=543632 RepID=UPI00055616A8|nr:hypothetical protein [Actinoplanes subtropicus]